MRLVSNKMIGKGLFILTILSNCVLSLPVTPSQLENEDDVQVMKCIVEALADVLSRPHPNPVSQECLVTLRTDDKLVSILRHRNFLKELQEIAVKGGQDRAQLQREAGADSTTQSPQPASDASDRSMLEALGGPGERSILSQKRRTGHGVGEEEKDHSQEDGESQEDNNITEEEQVKRENDEGPGSHVSESEDERSEGKAEKREEEEEGSDLNSQEKSEEGSMAEEKKGARSSEKTDAHRNKSKENKSDEEDKEEEDKRSMFLSHRQGQKHQVEEDKKETKRGGLESVKHWTKRGKAMSLRKKAVDKELTSEQEVPHHSKEVSEEVEEKKKRNTQRSLEEKELQMIARSGPVERRGLEEEGSASRKSEEPEIESLAAIESELENVAQKLHELRRG
ncbi:chromogranin-A [Notolabrus celidotus]|uniref:chromogranin-A n=1 Tax=Notolabrus celidotus TaxID=1203425 RepID=UPI00148F55F5|nr:chromogranin-A [Notolabrus celidotus]